MILITGADGYVGQKLAPLLKKVFINEKILCLIHNGQDDFEKTGRKILKKNGLQTLEIDLVSGKNLDKLPKNPELVIHLAANTDTSKKDHQVNDIGTRNLLEAIGPLNPKTHFIYTSTTVLMSGRLRCDKPIKESDEPLPTNEYGRSKARAEKILLRSLLKEKFRLTLIRINTIYGQDPRKHKMFKVLLSGIKKNSLVTRLNWPGLTSLIYVDDVVSAILGLSKKLPKAGQVERYVLSAESLSMSQISQIMYQRLGLEYKPINLPGFFWKFCSVFRVFIPLLEPFLPLKIYNLFWRIGLIVDDVIYCNSTKLKKTLPSWKPKKLVEVVDEVIT